MKTIKKIALIVLRFGLPFAFGWYVAGIIGVAETIKIMAVIILIVMVVYVILREG